MLTKLTLALDDAIIKKAKEYAQKRKLSLSKLVEFYLTFITSGKKGETHSLPPITSQLSGMIRVKAGVKDKRVLEDALIEKYL
jgi:hypothetical protein